MGPTGPFRLRSPTHERTVGRARNPRAAQTSGPGPDPTGLPPPSGGWDLIPGNGHEPLRMWAMHLSSLPQGNGANMARLPTGPPFTVPPSTGPNGHIL